MGDDAGARNTTGSSNTFNGYYAGQENTTGDQNTFIGCHAGRYNTGGVLNTFIGFNSGRNVTAGNWNVSVGPYAGGYNTTGSDNVTLGGLAGGSTDSESGGIEYGSANVFIGTNAGRQASQIGDFNVVLGYGAARKYAFPYSRSIFLVNNQAQMSNPMLYGTFAANSDHFDPASSINPFTKAQLAINTNLIQPDMTLTVNGAMYIGNIMATTQPVSSAKLNHYNLWVEKGIVSENFAVAKVADWADHVFKTDYKLMPLKDVENYVKQHKHLPDVPSEDELKKDGYELHSMNKNFITKIEELTLYTIEQDKKRMEQEERIQAQQTEIRILKNSLESYNALANEVAELKKLINSNK